MEHLSSIDNYIRALISKSPQESDETVSTAAIYQRANIITELTNIRKELDYMNAKLQANVEKLMMAQQNELLKMKDVLVKFGTPKEAQIICAPRLRVTDTWEHSEKKPAHELAKITEIIVKKELSLSAHIVDSFDQVVDDGKLYYIGAADHFAVRVSGMLIHGNVGNIFIDEKIPSKVKNCKFSNRCLKKDSCDYYHDPLEHSGSTDRRNYVVSSWLYQPSSGMSKYRKFGSYSRLEEDIWTMTREDIDRFRDQVMHDILCLLLLNKYVP